MEVQPLALFSEPSGWETARVRLSGSLAFIGMYVYSELVHSSGVVAILVIEVASGISGIAEMLPDDRRYVASVSRIVAIGVLVVLVVLSLHRLVA